MVSGGEADQELSNLKVKVRSEVVQRPARSSGRRTQVKILRPLAGSAAEDKEVETTPNNVIYHHILFFMYRVCKVLKMLNFICYVFKG